MSGYIDLALTPAEVEEQQVANTPLAEAPKYPYCTTFSLDERVLEEIDHEDWSVDDVFHFHIMAKITGINSHENQDGKKKCVNFQITAIKGENHEEESEESEDDGVVESGAYLKPGG